MAAPTETSNETCNGWTNYETWNVNLWLSNEPGTAEMLREIAMDAYEYQFQAEEALREFVEEVFELPTEGLAADLLGHALARVNWREIIESARED